MEKKKKASTPQHMHTEFTLKHSVKEIIMSWIKDQSLSEKVIVLQS